MQRNAAAFDFHDNTTGSFHAASKYLISSAVPIFIHTFLSSSAIGNGLYGTQCIRLFRILAI